MVAWFHNQSKLNIIPVKVNYQGWKCFATEPWKAGSKTDCLRKNIHNFTNRPMDIFDRD